MGKKLPLLKPREVEANLSALGFRHARTVGSHKQYVRDSDGVCPRAIVTVDVGKTQFDAYLMKMMIRQSLLSQEEFCSGILKESKSEPTLEPALAPEPITAVGEDENA
jgi:predicted RNA binding protein YcfA (HicA-like mRNA interferase family)